MTPALDLRIRWEPLWWRWSALLWGCALALAVLVIWRGEQVSEQQQRTEQEAVLQEIGRALVSNLDRAQAMGIPLREAVGLEPWMAAQLHTSQQVSGLGLVLTSGDVLARHGVDAEWLRLVSRVGDERPASLGRPWVRLPIVAPGEKQAMAWLHVVGPPPDRPWPQILGTLTLAALTSLLAIGTVRGWLRRSVGRRLERIRQQLMQMAAGELVSGRVTQPEPGQHEVALLDHALALRWATLKQRQAALLQKLNEVRAAHFDTAVLARIDALAAPLLHAQGAATDIDSLLPQARRGWKRWTLRGQVAVVMWSLWALLLAGLLGLEGLHTSRVQDAQAQAQVLRLRTAFDQALGEDLARLSPLALPTVVTTARSGGLSTVEELLPPAARWWMRAGNDVAQTLAGREAPPGAPPTAEVMAELALHKEGSRGIWAGADRQLQVGVACMLALADGSSATVVATQPLASTLGRLAQVLQSRLALADHRGHPLGPDPGGLIPRWQLVAGDAVTLSDSTWLVSLPLMSHTGHTLGHLVAELPIEGPPPAGSGSAPLLFALWLAVGAGIWWVLQQIRPLGEVATEVARLAESPASGRLGDVRVDDLRRDIARVENRLEALRALRRSRDRQGRRQARFIRHQMLELANRLDEAARADVLKDLERIESAGLKPASAEAPREAAAASDPRFERMADEVGVLALGFQNLVGRVGDQYHQLAQLVQELREALQMKTQFIAIQQELDIARKMQLAFLPHNFSNQAGVQLHGVTHPARDVGGDFYDFFRLDEHHLAVLVADVSGKGVPAAFFMAISRTLLRAVAQFSQRPAACLQRLNDLLAAENEEMMFVTLFYAVIDTRSGGVVYSNAGHNPPYVIRRDGQIEAVPSLGDMPLAVMTGTLYAERALTLHPGDALFLYTDGVTEAKSPEGGWFGEPALEAFLRSAGQSAEVQTISTDLVEAVKRHEAGGAQSDDITCLTVRLAAHATLPGAPPGTAPMP